MFVAFSKSDWITHRSVQKTCVSSKTKFMNDEQAAIAILKVGICAWKNSKRYIGTIPLIILRKEVGLWTERLQQSSFTISESDALVVYFRKSLDLWMTEYILCNMTGQSHM